MPSLHCRSPFVTGLDLIDAQHKELFEALGSLSEDIASGAPQARVDGWLAFLAQHTIRHCHTEESLMKDAGFPDRIAHANLHLELILQIRELQYERTKGREVGPDVVACLWGWLDHHIREADRVYVRHITGSRNS
ncbi:MAG TPA: hemerythrin family protein [Geothrix sp.]|nr:hemerythrin family protein [Geothrix sp.]